MRPLELPGGAAAAHRVGKPVIFDPQEKTVSWVRLEGGEYTHLERSRLSERALSSSHCGSTGLERIAAVRRDGAAK
jgi:hypothetical protein